MDGQWTEGKKQKTTLILYNEKPLDIRAAEAVLYWKCCTNDQLSSKIDQKASRMLIILFFLKLIIALYQWK